MTSDIRAQLRGGRAVEHSGVLHLDREAARRKISAFTMPSPHFWVLQVVRLAVLSGATQIRFEVSVRNVQIDFDAVIAPELLADIWNVALDPRTTPKQQAVRFLALGLAAARALGPERLTVHSGGVLLVCHADREEVLEAEPIAWTRVECLEKFRLAHVAEFFTQRHEEEPILRQRASFAALDVVVNGTLISASPTATFQIASASVAFHRVAQSGVDLTATVGGVSVYDQAWLSYEAGLRHGWRIAVEDPTTNLDLTTLSASLEDVLPNVGLTALVQFFTEDPLRFVALPLAEQNALFVALLHLSPSELAKQLLTQVIDVPFLQAANRKGLISLASTFRTGHHRITTKFAEEEDIAYMEDDSLSYLLRLHGIPTIDATRFREVKKISQINESRWRHQEQVMLFGEVVTDEASGYRGSIELVDRQSGIVRFCKDLRVITEKPLTVPVLLQIDGPLRVNATFDDIVHDDASVAFVEKMILAAPGAFWVANLDLARELITLVLSGEFDQKLRLDTKVPASCMPESRSLAERLGELMDTKIFSTNQGLVSIRDILKAKPVPMIGPVPKDEDEARLVIDPRNNLADLLKLLDVQSFYEHRFMAKPTFVPPQPTFETVRAGVKLQFIIRGLRTSTSTSTLHVMYRDRLLCSQPWNSKHSDGEVYVWWDQITPTPEFDGVATADAHWLALAVKATEALALTEWLATTEGDSAPNVTPLQWNVPDETITDLVASIDALLEVQIEDELSKQIREAAQLDEPPRREPEHEYGGDLRHVYRTLSEARHGRPELIGDFMLHRLTMRPGDAPWQATEEGATLGAEHPLAERRGSHDPVEIAFLASTAATAINAFYRSFSDTAELRLQANLMRACEPAAWDSDER